MKSPEPTLSQKKTALELHNSECHGKLCWQELCDNGRLCVIFKCEGGFRYTLYIGKRGKVFEKECEWM